jgi:tight adherence protein C
MPFELPFGLDFLDIATFLAGLAVFIGVYAIWTSGLQRDPMRGRIKSLQSRRDSLRAGYVATKRRETPIIKKVDRMTGIRTFVDKLKLVQTSRSKNVAIKLARAGYRSKDAIVFYSFSKFLSPIAGVIVAVIVVLGLNIVEKQLYQAATALAIVLLGYYAPDLFVKNAADNRVKEIRKSLPDALDLMVICAEAGLTLDSAMNKVAREMGPANPELGDEFMLTGIELGFLPERRQALVNLAERVDLASIRSVVATLIQTEKYGTPLSQSLRVLSAEFRNQRLMRAEEKAARLPAIMTVPLIMFILPTLFVVLLGPAACQVNDQFITRFGPGGPG